VLLADIFNVSLDDLISSREPTQGEAAILCEVASGNEKVVVRSFSDISGLAPLLKPSILEKLSERLAGQEIDISNVVSLAEYLSDVTTVKLLETATFGTINDLVLVV